MTNEVSENVVRVFLPHGTLVEVNGVSVRLLGDALIETTPENVPVIFNQKSEPILKVHIPKVY